MSTVQKTVTVEPNTMAVGEALAKFVSDVKGAFQSGSKLEEIASVAQAALTDLLPAISAMNQIVPEAKSDPISEATTVYLTGLLIYQAITGKKS